MLWGDVMRKFKSIFLLFFVFMSVLTCSLFHRFDETPPPDNPLTKDDVASLRVYLNNVYLSPGKEFVTPNIRQNDNIHVLVKIYNSGKNQVQVSGIYFNGTYSSEYSHNFSLPIMILPNEFIEGYISINPLNNTDIRITNLTVNSTDIVLPNYTVKLITNVLPPPSGKLEVRDNGGTIKINNSLFNYGDVDRDATHDRNFSIKNIGDATLSVNSLTITNTTDFTISAFSPTILNPGDSYGFTVSLKSGLVGFVNNAVNITSNDPNIPNYNLNITGQRINLTGALPVASVSTTLQTPLSGLYITKDSGNQKIANSEKITLTFSKSIKSLNFVTNELGAYTLDQTPSPVNPRTTVVISPSSSWAVGNKTVQISYTAIDDTTNTSTAVFKVLSNVLYAIPSGVSTNSGSVTSQPTTLQDAFTRMKEAFTNGEIKLSGGNYTIASNILANGISYTGGYDSSFGSYNPTTNQTIINTSITGTGTEAMPLATLIADNTISSPIEMKGLTIFGPTSGSYTAGLIVNTSNVIIQECKIYGGLGTSRSTGIVFASPDTNSITPYLHSSTVFGNNSAKSGQSLGVEIRAYSNPDIQVGTIVFSGEVNASGGVAIGAFVNGIGSYLSLDNSQIIAQKNSGTGNSDCSIGVQLINGGIVEISNGSIVKGGEGGGNASSSTDSFSIGLYCADISTSSEIFVNGSTVEGFFSKVGNGQFGNIGIYMKGNHRLTISNNSQIYSGSGSANTIRAGIVLFDNNQSPSYIGISDSSINSYYPNVANKSYGIYISNIQNNMEINNNTIESGNSSFECYGVYSSASNLTISGNTINAKNDITGASGAICTVFVTGSLPLDIHSNFLNVISPNSMNISHVIRVQDSNNSFPKKIYSNQVIGGNNTNSKEERGIVLINSKQFDIYDNSKIEGRRGGTGIGVGIYIENVNDTVIYNNGIIAGGSSLNGKLYGMFLSGSVEPPTNKLPKLLETISEEVVFLKTILPLTSPPLETSDILFKSISLVIVYGAGKYSKY